MRAGKLRNRITILQKNISKDKYGDTLEQWAHNKCVWAEVKNTKQNDEVYEDKAILNKKNLFFNIRKTQVQLDNAILYENKRYLIVSIDSHLTSLEIRAQIDQHES